MAATVKITETEAHVGFIPRDIMANIFKRLSVRSLTRLRCVCTHWKNLINDLIKTPSFIEDHFNCSRCRKPLLLLEQYHRRFRGISLRVLDCDMRVQKVQKLPSTHSLYDFKVLGSSNGLVCVKIENGINPHPILIWNPVTRDIREVRPRTIVHSDLIAEVGLEFYRTHTDPRELDDRYGFGFSPLDNDYKIVRINEHNHYDIKAVEVYSLNCGSWKHIDVGDDLDGLEFYRTHIDPRELDDHYGFGFSPLDNDYKIVRINEYNHYHIKAVEVYSLNCGSWKHIDVGDDLRGISTSATYITINGVMFWDFTWCDDEDLILPIDLLKKGVCEFIPLPRIYGGFRRASLIEY
ncbi:uncharacterized protein LOC114714202 [Neltuma alba]|uniref:uncharacterized protein LOC114714202 n=1 Tax=Neltuma alba TaxID=207710 RepID=UPI0010A55360|nr:uncharacterized protein LOC114714202 [Prosopis alba]